MEQMNFLLFLEYCLGFGVTDIWVGKSIPLARNREQKPSTIESEIQQKQCSLIK